MRAPPSCSRQRAEGPLETQTAAFIFPWVSKGGFPLWQVFEGEALERHPSRLKKPEAFASGFFLPFFSQPRSAARIMSKQSSNTSARHFFMFALMSASVTRTVMPVE